MSLSEIRDEIPSPKLGVLRSSPDRSGQHHHLVVPVRPSPPGNLTNRARGATSPKYSDLAFDTALTLRLLFHLPLRQADGFLTDRILT